MAPLPRPLDVGDVIHGFAQGAFGRDHFDCVRIEAVGPDWIAARAAPDDAPQFASGRDSLEFIQRARDEPCANHPCPLHATTDNGAPLTTWKHA